MNAGIVCIPVADDGQIGHTWGKARTVALATVEDGTITSWRTRIVDGSRDIGSAWAGLLDVQVAR